jgi:hypothetical protein
MKPLKAPIVDIDLVQTVQAYFLASENLSACLDKYITAKRNNNAESEYIERMHAASLSYCERLPDLLARLKQQLETAREEVSA